MNAPDMIAEQQIESVRIAFGHLLRLQDSFAETFQTFREERDALIVSHVPLIKPDRAWACLVEAFTQEEIEAAVMGTPGPAHVVYTHAKSSLKTRPLTRTILNLSEEVKQVLDVDGFGFVEKLQSHTGRCAEFWLTGKTPLAKKAFRLAWPRKNPLHTFWMDRLERHTHIPIGLPDDPLCEEGVNLVNETLALPHKKRPYNILRAMEEGRVDTRLATAMMMHTHLHDILRQNPTIPSWLREILPEPNPSRHDALIWKRMLERAKPLADILNRKEPPQGPEDIFFPKENP